MSGGLRKLKLFNIKIIEETNPTYLKDLGIDYRPEASMIQSEIKMLSLLLAVLFLSVFSKAINDAFQNINPFQESLTKNNAEQVIVLGN
jgi:hypothetical protein